MFDLVQHLRSAWRVVRFHPWFALALAGGIAVSSGFTGTAMTLARALTAPAVAGPADPAGLLAIYRWSADGQYVAAAADDLERVRGETGVIAVAGAASVPRVAAVRVGDLSGEARVVFTYDGLFEALALSPVEGRLLSIRDADAAGPVPVVASRAFLDGRLGTGVGVGSRVTIDGTDHVLVGVLPARFDGFELGRPTELWLPRTHPDAAGGSSPVTIVARVRPGVSREDLQGRQPALAPVPFTRIDPEYRRRLAPVAWTMFLAGAMVLASGAVGVAALLISRNAERLDEIGARAALGATVARLRTQLAVESGAIAIAACAGSAVLAFWTVRLLLSMLAPEQASVLGVEIGLGRLLAIGASSLVIWIPVCVACAHYVCRAAPALLRRSAGSLRDSPIGMTLQRRLLGLQTALACTLLIVVALLTRGFEQTLTAGMGKVAGQIAIVSSRSPGAYLDVARAVRYQQTALEQVLRVPNVVSVAWTSTLPLVDGPRAYWSTSAGGPPGAYRTVLVSDSYFRTMQLDIVKGRGFEAADDVPYATALVVNAALASRLFPDSPISPRLFDPQGTLHPVVGVVADGRFRQMESGAEPTVFRPLSAEFSWYLHLVVRGTVDAAASLPRIRATLDRIDQASMVKEQSLEAHLDGALRRDRVAVVLVRACGALVLLLSLSGAYLLAESIALRRRREMAVRLALGSTRRGLAAAMIQRALAPTTAGVCLGAVAGYAAMPALRTLTGTVPGSELVVFAEVAAAVLGLSVLATAIPALAAARAIDPISTLR